MNLIKLSKIYIELKYSITYICISGIILYWYYSAVLYISVLFHAIVFLCDIPHYYLGNTANINELTENICVLF